ncbi:hypothetical protein [Larkinella soli]|uniref:hypothetical protein n=1 Tax=Larkinella soli TaxID=1770527 RepID=UPI000FFB5A00|nr:hypothetical protein [Larkinella soli]
MKRLLLTLGISAGLLTAGPAVSQESRPANVPSVNTARTPLPEGSGVFGVFDGRVPCAGLAETWKVPLRPECTKVKLRIVLFQDPATRRPTTYRLFGTMNRDRVREGRWELLRRTPSDPEAVILKLDPDRPDVSLSFLQADDHVLFMLDQKGGFRVGNADFSYTLNRVINPGH